MRAAAYGKSFCEGYDASKFVEACKTLRVLNAVRQPEIGLPLTHPQYERLTQGIVVARLIRPGRFHHYLALRICNYLRMPLNHILVDWACAKIRASEKVPDAELRDAIRTKLKGCRVRTVPHTAKEGHCTIQHVHELPVHAAMCGLHLLSLSYSHLFICVCLLFLLSPRKYHTARLRKLQIRVVARCWLRCCSTMSLDRRARSGN